jgi:hypothetical protein
MRKPKAFFFALVRVISAQEQVISKVFVEVITQNPKGGDFHGILP